MKLEEYLKGIRECPDEDVEIIDCGNPRKIHRLTYDYGVYDNAWIYVGLKFKEVVNHLISKKECKVFSPYYPINLNYELEQGNDILLRNKEGDKSISVNRNKYPKKYGNKEFNEFSFIIICNTNKGYTAPDGKSHWEQRTADYILEFGELALERLVPIEFAKSVGWKYLNSKEPKEHVVFPTEEEIELFQ